MERLSNDPNRQLHSTDELRQWIAGDGAWTPWPTSILNNAHHGCMVLDGTGIYTGPADDFSRQDAW